MRVFFLLYSITSFFVFVVLKRKLVTTRIIKQREYSAISLPIYSGKKAYSKGEKRSGIQEMEKMESVHTPALMRFRIHKSIVAAAILKCMMMTPYLF